MRQVRRTLTIIIMCLAAVAAKAQYNTDRLIIAGRSAMYYQDFVLAIQYFNQAIAAKPYLYEPWYFRSIAKYYLDDYVGAEADCTEAIDRNPFVYDIYELRAVCRANIENYDGAIADYNKSLKYNPDNRNSWFNRALCEYKKDSFDIAIAQLDTITDRWQDIPTAYLLKSEIYLQKKDTTAAEGEVDKALGKDPYLGDAWSMKSSFALYRQDWKMADSALTQAIHYKPLVVNNYIHRALARHKMRNLRGAMADYDKALDLDPENFIAHYNRGLLRQEVGDDNKAITDFDFVLKLEPNNIMALYNRAMLLHQTGDQRGAIRDYSKIIQRFPNFWAGLQMRADCYRRLGMTAQAEKDEFRIFKAQLDKRYGQQKRWKRGTADAIRKKSDEDLEKYNQLVIADDADNKVSAEYQNEYRGKVQNRKVNAELQPLFFLSFQKYRNGMRSRDIYDKDAESIGRMTGKDYNVYVACRPGTLSEYDSKRYFAAVDTLTNSIDVNKSNKENTRILMLRAIAYGDIQNFTDAIDDLGSVIAEDSLQAAAYWQRAVMRARSNEFTASQGIAEGQSKAATGSIVNLSIIADFDRAITLRPNNPFLYYDRGTFYTMLKKYDKALEDFDKAIELDKRFAEAYFNRGLTKYYSGDKDGGRQDLSKAGELGLYDAYSVMKEHSK